jgi:hypothetical protein
MAKFLNKLRKFIDQRLAKIGCKLYGHHDIVILERYRTQQIIRVALGSDSLNRLVRKSPSQETIVRGKLRCPHCGSVFIGIVKGNDNVAYTQ